MDSQSLYDRFGGDGQISELIDQFYYKVLFDKGLRNQFLKVDMCRVRQQQKRYFATLMGSSIPYEGRDIVEVHTHLKISDTQFDSFKAHMHTILGDMELPADIISEVLTILENQRKDIVIL